MMQRRKVRKKKKLSVEEKIKSNQVKILKEFICERSQTKRTAAEMSAARECPTRFSHLKFVLLLTCHLASIFQASASSLSDFDGATFYKAPLGSRIRIACNASHWDDDSISLVLWFKGNPTGAAGQLKPIYTIDARQKPLSSGQARHLIGDSLKGRARFVFPNVSHSGQQQQQQQPQPLVPYLDLAPLEADDQAEYRCRVDYRSRPRENFLVVLFVLVPPKSVEIVDASGRQVEQIYGPLNEGSELRLVCLSRGGRPPPAIVWKRNGRLIDESYLTLNDFLTLKLANGSHHQRHHQQRQQSGDNNLMRGPSQQTGGGNQTAAADWLGWPEFNYFRQLLRADQSPVRARHQPIESSGGGLPQPQLIDLQVDQTAATAVNVLHLNELTRAHLLGNWPQAEESSSAGRQQEPTSAQQISYEPAKLECDASNEHYDLHTLIKLFAPASLVESRPLQQQIEFVGRNSPPSSTLMQAIERAIWASLNASAVLETESTQQHESLPLTTKQQRQQPPEDVVPVQNSSQLNWPLVIEQQLIRPHQQLVAAAGAELSNSGTSAKSAKSSSPQPQPPPPSSQLIRSALIALEANLRPLDVRILQTSRPLVAGQVHEFTCQSSGSRPAARLAWLKDGQRLEPSASSLTRTSAGNDGDDKQEAYRLSDLAASSLISQSRLTLRLRREDQNARLTCQAENERFKQANEGNNNERDWRLEDNLTLNVHYVPQVRLELGNRMLSETVREGQDIYFVCQCDSNPAVNEITWLHNDRPINETLASSDASRARSLPSADANGRITPATANLIVSNDSLVLQRVQLEQAGQYTCLASNSEGVGLSNQIELRVLHAPICVTSASVGGQQRAALNQIDNQLVLSLGPFKRPQQPPAATGRNLGSTRAKALRLTCQMLVPEHEDDQLEIAWWSNSTGGERRLLARQTSRELKLIDVRQADLIGLPWQRLGQSTAGIPDEATNQRASDMTANRRLRLAVAHLDLNWTSDGDSKQMATDEHVFCLARNSLGDQKRACHYAIEQKASEENHARDSDWDSSRNGNDQRTGQHLACLSLNVTASSAWIGCDSSGARLVAGGQLDELNQVDENNDRLRASALGQVEGQHDDEAAARANKTSGGQIGHAELVFQFNVLVFSLAQSPTTTTATKYEASRQLEANLSSGQLSEPLFVVTNLRPNADYLLEIEDQSGRISSSDSEHTDYKPDSTTTTTTINLRTGPDELKGGGPPPKIHYEAARPKPSIRQVTEPHPADLLVSALISTRSITGTGDRLGGPSLQQQQQQHRTESMWSTLLGRPLDLRSDSAVAIGAKTRRPWRADGRSNAADLARSWPSQSDWASPLALCILSLMLLLVVLVGLTAIRKSRLWSGQPVSNSYDETKLSPLKRSAGNMTNEQDDDHDDDDASEDTREGPRSAVSRSSSPPSLADKRNRELEMGPPQPPATHRADQKLAMAAAHLNARQTIQNHHYSTLDSHPLVAQHLASAFEQPASLNFLKSSSIATLRRRTAARGQRQPVATCPQSITPAAAATVTRSRSSLGFGGASGVGESSLLLLTEMQAVGAARPDVAAAAAVASNPVASRQKLIQLSCARRASLEQAVLLDADGGQSAEWLISDANFGLATTSETATTTTSYTLMAPGDAADRPNHDQGAEFKQWPYMERVSKPDRIKRVSGLGETIRHGNQSDSYALGASRLVSEMSPSSGCCADETDDSHRHVCNCQATTLRGNLIVCCPTEHQHGADQQQCASFIELVPNLSETRGHIPINGRHAHQLDLRAFELQMESQIGNHAINHGGLQMDKQCHQLSVNQSLNSSSIGSPSTNNQLGSSPLGSLTNTTPPNSNTESSCQTNNLVITTGRADELKPKNCNKTDRRLTSILKNHYNHSASDSDAPFQFY